MTKEEKLISLLQPKDYKSKIKLFCLEKEFKIEKFAQEKNKLYISRIEIKEK